MKSLVFFLLGALFVVVGEWVYLNFINRSAGSSLLPNHDDNVDVSDGDNDSELRSNAASGGGAAVATTAQKASRGGGRAVVQAVSKGRAFLDRMAAKEQGEATAGEKVRSSQRKKQIKHPSQFLKRQPSSARPLISRICPRVAMI